MCPFTNGFEYNLYLEVGKIRCKKWMFGAQEAQGHGGMGCALPTYPAGS